MNIHKYIVYSTYDKMTKIDKFITVNTLGKYYLCKKKNLPNMKPISVSVHNLY